MALAPKIGVVKAAKELGLYATQIYSWRKSKRMKEKTSSRESALATENARLKHQLAIQAELREIGHSHDLDGENTLALYLNANPKQRIAQ